MTANVKGAAELLAKLGRIADETQKIMAREVKRALLAVQNEAKLRAPVDTGRLRNSITHEQSEDGLSGVVGTNVEYAPYQEFGTSRMAAHPFLFPALMQEYPIFVARLKQEMTAAFLRNAAR